MTTRHFADLHPVAGLGALSWRSAATPTGAAVRTIAGEHADLGPFVVRRFVDFARTKSMMCRMSA